jgi:tyrosyl-tRNA synthetase
LGHKVTVLVGDYTGRIGDPSGHSETRKQLTTEDVNKCCEDWKKQIKNLIDFNDPTNPAKYEFNSTWLDKLTTADLLRFMSEISVQRMLERDLFDKRIKAQQPLFMHEMMYPLFQGLDSLFMGTDVEICGHDQRFNALMGRQLVKRHLNKDNFIVILDMMDSPDGTNMFSKSRGTGVFLSEDPDSMFGHTMSFPDWVTPMLFKWLTKVPTDELPTQEWIEANPMEAKKLGAQKMLELIFNDEQVALLARQTFEKTFSKREWPEDAPVIIVIGDTLGNILKKCLPDKSNSDLRRLVQQGAVTLDGAKLDDFSAMITEGTQLKVGKLNFFSLRF